MYQSLGLHRVDGRRFMSRTVTWHLFIILVLFLFFSNGCATREISPEIQPDKQEKASIDIRCPEDFQWPDSAFENMFRKYWGLRKQGDSAEAWKMEAPYIHEMVIKGRYLSYYGTERNDWKTIQILKKSQGSDSMIYIEFNMDTQNSEGERKDVYFRDFWVYYDGRWVHAIKDMFLTEN